MKKNQSNFLQRAILVASFPVSTLLSMNTLGAALEIEEILVTGFKYQNSFGEKSGIPLEKVPQSIQVISSDEIAELGATSIGDLLRNVPSASAGYSRVGSYQSFSLKVRGFLADQMRNGIRQRYYEDVDASALSNIERVEVLKGPSGVLYGQSAVGGVISIVTKRPQQEFAASGSLGLGSYNQKIISGDITGQLTDTLSARITGEIERSDSFVDHNPIDRNNIAFALEYSPTDSMTAHLVTEYVARDTQRYAGLPIKGTLESNGVAPIDISANLGEPSIGTLEANAPLIQLWVDIKLSENWSLTPRLQYSGFETEFAQIRVLKPQENNSTLINRSGRLGHEDDEYSIAQLDTNGSFSTGNIHHQVLFGYEYDLERSRFTQHTITNLQAINALNPRYTYATVKPTTSFAFDNFYNIDGDAFYVQDLIALTSTWDAVAAVRHSRIDASDGEWHGATANQATTNSTIWQLGTTVKLNETVSAYAGVNTGFDIESTAGARTKNGKPLLPEESRQEEIGLRFKQHNLRASVALFQLERLNALTADLSDADYSVNAGEQRVRGLELETQWQVGDALELTAGYAFLDGEITKSNDGNLGGRIGDMPKHNITGRVNYKIPQTHWTLRGGVGRSTERALVNASNINLAGYTLADASVSYEQANWSLNFFAANITNAKYFSASGNANNVLPGDPRTFGVRITTKL